VICSKISPEFEGVPTTDFLPICEILPKCIYVLYISQYPVSSRPRYIGYELVMLERIEANEEMDSIGRGIYF
jgi:hypothetical protein